MPHSMTGFSTAEDAASRRFGSCGRSAASITDSWSSASGLPEDAARCRARVPRPRRGASSKRGKVDCTLKVGADDGRAAPARSLSEDALERLRALEDGVRARVPGGAAADRRRGACAGPACSASRERSSRRSASPSRAWLRTALRRAAGDVAAREGERHRASMLEKRNAAITALRRRRPAAARRRAGALSRQASRALAAARRAGRAGALEQELALLAQRLDVAEEVDRLDERTSRSCAACCTATSRWAGGSTS